MTIRDPLSPVYPAGVPTRPSLLDRLRASTRAAVWVLFLVAIQLGAVTVCAASELSSSRTDEPAAVVDAAALTCADEGCCDQSHCDECCTPAAVLLSPVQALPLLASVSALPRWAIGWVPTSYPVAIRPPIAA
jgi:hypothetical protein